MIRTKRHATVTAAACLGAATLLLTGCSSGNSGNNTSKDTAKPAASSKHHNSVSPSPSSSHLTPDQAAAVKAYRDFLDAQETTFKQGSPSGTRLFALTSGKAREAEMGDLVKVKQSGVVYRGTSTSRVKLLDIDTTTTPPAAKIWECRDDRKSYPVYKASGKRAPDEKNKRFPVEAILERSKEKQWVVTQLGANRSGSC